MCLYEISEDKFWLMIKSEVIVTVILYGKSYNAIEN